MNGRSYICRPSISVSAYQHLFPEFSEVQVFLGNKLNPEDGGWKLTNNISIKNVFSVGHIQQ